MKLLPSIPVLGVLSLILGSFAGADESKLFIITDEERRQLAKGARETIRKAEEDYLAALNWKKPPHSKWTTGLLDGGTSFYEGDGYRMKVNGSMMAGGLFQVGDHLHGPILKLKGNLLKETLSCIRVDGFYQIPREGKVGNFGKGLFILPEARRSEMAEWQLKALQQADEDYRSVLAGKLPVHSELIRGTTLKDGGTATYQGPGYKVKVMRRVSSLGKIKGVVYGPVVIFRKEYIDEPLACVRFYSDSEYKKLIKAAKAE